MPKRHSYTVQFKLSVIKRAEELNNNRKAAEEFNINEKSVRQWRKVKSELSNMNPNKRANRCKKIKWPCLEVDLKNWLIEKRGKNEAVSTVAIRNQAKRMALQKNITDFKGGFSWIFKFMKRNKLSVRTRTTVGQQLPDNWEELLNNFNHFVDKEIQEHNISPKDIINMDEIPMSFDIPPTRTVAETGSKTVKITTTGNERNHFTVVLACAANGVKLRPMIIFKRVTKPRENIPNEIFLYYNKKGWMDTNLMKLWVENCLRRRPGSFFTKKSLLVLDSMAAHREKSVQELINKVGYNIAVIPGGLTKKLQPLDIAVNHSFKCHVRAEWANWMTSGNHTFTASGHQRRATYNEVCNWVINAWNKITSQTIINGFRKANICFSHSEVQSDSDSSFDDEDFSNNISYMNISESELQNLIDNTHVDDNSNDHFEGFDESD